MAKCHRSRQGLRTCHFRSQCRRGVLQRNYDPDSAPIRSPSIVFNARDGHTIFGATTTWLPGLPAKIHRYHCITLLAARPPAPGGRAFGRIAFFLAGEGREPVSCVGRALRRFPITKRPPLSRSRVADAGAQLTLLVSPLELLGLKMRVAWGVDFVLGHAEFWLPFLRSPRNFFLGCRSRFARRLGHIPFFMTVHVHAAALTTALQQIQFHLQYFALSPRCTFLFLTRARTSATAHGSSAADSAHRRSGSCLLHRNSATLCSAMALAIACSAAFSSRGYRCRRLSASDVASPVVSTSSINLLEIQNSRGCCRRHQGLLPCFKIKSMWGRVVPWFLCRALLTSLSMCGVSRSRGAVWKQNTATKIFHHP